MARKAVLVIALALLVTCGPSLVTPTPQEAATSTQQIASSDLITLREGGQQSKLVIRRVASADKVREVPDGMLLPDGKTVLVVEPGGATTVVKKVDRMSGAVTATHEIPGTWVLYRGYPSFGGASVDGSHVVLYGSSYNYTDQSGTWTSRTAYGVVDLGTWKTDPIELAGRFGLVHVSNDGRQVYLSDYTELPTKLRVYDVATRKLADVAGDTTPSLADSFAGKITLGSSVYGVVSSTESVLVRPDVYQVTAVAKLGRLDLATQTVRTLRLPVEQIATGEAAFAWSVIASRDGKALYAANPAAGVIIEIDPSTYQVLRTAPLTDAKSTSPLDGLLALLHPVAAAKVLFITGAVLSPDGATMYVLADQGVWSVELQGLKTKMLTRDGSFMTVAISPDGKRLYVMDREHAIVSALDAQSGKLLGSMKQIAMPSDIIAVDAG